MGDLGTLSDILGGVGVADAAFVSGPQTEAANQARFDTAEGRRADSRGTVQGGDPNLDQVPQSMIDRARQTGEVIIKRADGSFIITPQESVNRLLGGTANEGNVVVDLGRGPGSFELARVGTQGFQDIRENVLGRFGDLESALIPGFQDREQRILGNFADLETRLNTRAQGRTDTGMGLINQLMAQLQGGFGQLQGDVAGGFDTLRGDLLGALEGAGGQERIDINETFDNLGDATQAGLISSGLSGTTILPSLQADVARQRTGAQGRLDERLRQQELGAISSTGFGALGAQQNIGLAGLASQQGLGQFGAGLFSNLSGDALDLSSLLGAAGIGLQQDLSGQTLGAQERIGQFGIGLEGALGADAINAAFDFGQLPLNFDIGLTGSEVDLDVSQLTRQGVNAATLFSQWLSSISQPDTPQQSSSFENIFTGAFG